MGGWYCSQCAKIYSLCLKKVQNAYFMACSPLCPALVRKTSLLTKKSKLKVNLSLTWQMLGTPGVTYIFLHICILAFTSDTSNTDRMLLSSALMSLNCWSHQKALKNWKMLIWITIAMLYVELQKTKFVHRVCVFSSFNFQARYQQRSLGPIQQSTILVVDPAKGGILKASGRNM